MNGYSDRGALVSAYVERLIFNGMPPDVAKLHAENSWVYVPHLYRGGYVIRGFGFSVERVGVYVLPGRCGNPAVV